MRLRTLPLSLAGTVTGIFCLGTGGCTHPVATVIFLALTTALLQVLSNLSNELGDTLHGTDTAQREGIHYSLQDGDMTIPQMRRLIACTLISCCISGIVMLWASFGTLIKAEVGILLGLGDLFVFIFFGLVSTCGACYVCAHDFSLRTVTAASILPACGIGCLSIGVLNVNNIRDAATDAANRTTVAILLGTEGARIYQTALIVAGLVFIAAHAAGLSAVLARMPIEGSWGRWLWLITIPLFIKHLHGVWTRSGRALDPMLPLLVISSFALALLLGAGSLL